MAVLIDRTAIHHTLVVELVRCIRDRSVDKGKMSERVLDCVDTAPAVEAEPVRHGRWVHDINNLYGCSECRERETMSHKKKKLYCPNCGVKMEE